MHDTQVIFIFVLTRLIRNAIISGILGFISGSVIGYGIGAMRRRIEDTVYVAIVGAIAGSLCICLVPPVAQPGSLESWGNGGGLGSMVVILSIGLIALGGIIGALLASTIGFRTILKLNGKNLGWSAIGILIVMSIVLYRAYNNYCFPKSTFC